MTEGNNGDNMDLCGKFDLDESLRADAGAHVHLRVLATSDLHAHLMPFDYYTDQREDRIRLVRLSALISEARREVANCLLFDNGDTLQGAPLADAAVQDLAAGRTHPMIAAMNALGYDAGTLGNHDFDFGLPYLQHALSQAAFPIVLSNCDMPAAPEIGAKRIILNREVEDAKGGRHRLSIGVIGLTPPQTLLWNRGSLGEGIRIYDMLETARTEAAALRAQGADLVVVLAHSGHGTTTDPAVGSENVAAAIAALNDVDAVVAGHSHEILPDPAHVAEHNGNSTTPLVQPGSCGSHLGCIDLALVAPDARDPSARWAIRRARACALSTTERHKGIRTDMRSILRQHPELRAQLGADHRATRRYTARPIGATEVPLETYFSMIAPCPATQLVADAKATAARQLVAKDAALRDLPIVKAVAPFRCGGRSGPDNYTSIDAGPMLLRDAASLYPFTNHFSLLRITGADIRDWLERSASAYHQIDPNGPPGQKLINTDFASYNFDRLVGLRYGIDVSRPARTDPEGAVCHDGPGRIGEITYSDGRPIAPEDEMLIMTSTYRAEGGGGFPMAARAQTVLIGREAVRDLLVHHIASGRQSFAPIPEATWHLVPLGGMRVTLETGPGSARYQQRAANLGLSAPRPGTHGFLHYDLTL